MKKIAQEYIDYLKKISNNSEKVTDKLPINFKWIGFIKLLLPNSTIIHCIRNPKDNCLSIFKNIKIGRLQKRKAGRDLKKENEFLKNIKAAWHLQKKKY